MMKWKWWVYAHHFLNYLSGGAMLIQNNGVDSLLYAYSDYQGSLIALTDESGTLVERYALVVPDIYLIK